MPYIPNDVDIEMMEAAQAADERDAVASEADNPNDMVSFARMMAVEYAFGWVESAHVTATTIVDDYGLSLTSDTIDSIVWAACERYRDWDDGDEGDAKDRHAAKRADIDRFAKNQWRNYRGG